MDANNILSLLQQLDDEIDDLEDALEPLIQPAIAETASKLPVLDKAKLYILVTYAIESVLFCMLLMAEALISTDFGIAYLRLNGVKAREHPVFQELTRVKQYFDKIKAAELPAHARENLSLNKQAAGRLIKAGLVSPKNYIWLRLRLTSPQAGNETYDVRRAEQQAREKARSHIKFEESSSNQKAAAAYSTKVSTSKQDSTNEESSTLDRATAPLKSKKRKMGATVTGEQNSSSTIASGKRKSEKDSNSTSKKSRRSA